MFFLLFSLTFSSRGACVDPNLDCLDFYDTAPEQTCALYVCKITPRGQKSSVGVTFPMWITVAPWKKSKFYCWCTSHFSCVACVCLCVISAHERLQTVSLSRVSRRGALALAISQTNLRYSFACRNSGREEMRRFDHKPLLLS
jgi:hypothetical protein